MNVPDIVDELNDPEKYYPGNFSTPERANAYYSGICQEAAEEIKKLRKTIEELHKEQAK